MRRRKPRLEGRLDLVEESTELVDRQLTYAVRLDTSIERATRSRECEPTEHRRRPTPEGVLVDPWHIEKRGRGEMWVESRGLLAQHGA